jgi:hypothetical protein
MVNEQGVPSIIPEENRQSRNNKLLTTANHNTDIWARMLWISGGNLNPDKCFFYWLQPEYNHSAGRIQYASTKRAPGTISIRNPATNERKNLTRVEPHLAKRTLGTMLAPDGNVRTQMQVCYDKASQFIGKIKHSKLPKHAKWTAVTSSSLESNTP